MLTGNSIEKKPASLKYSHPSLLRRIFLGNNYRREWATPVSLPLFHLSQSGLKILELGGGYQTKSLRLEDKSGKEWVLRTVDKDVEKALEKEGIRNRLARKVVTDMVSASHPYGALVVPDLASAAGVPSARPKYYFVADDKALGEYRSLFAGKLCMLEEREPTPDQSETESTEKLIEELNTDNEHLLLQKNILRARLLDMLIGDWDRHADQWRWGEKDSIRRHYYYAVPRDRDQALFYSDGVLVRLSGVFGTPHFVGFKKNIAGLKKLNHKAWNFDRTFLNELSAADWQRITTEFQRKVNDAVVKKAVNKLPPEIYAFGSEKIETKLKSRRDGILEAAMRYYTQLSYHVTVSGSAEAETFHVSQRNDSLVVTVYDKKGDKKICITKELSSRE